MDISELKRQHSLQRHPWELIRARVIKDLFKQYADGSNHILDIGSGDAFVLNELCKEFGAKTYTAIDTAYTPTIINQIKKDTTCNINHFPKLPRQLSLKADSVLLLDVIEHCQDDAAVLNSLCSSSIIEKNTILLITVPAFQSAFSQHDHLLGHYRRYSVKQLQSLCTHQGFTILRSGYFFTSLLIIRRIQLFLEKTGYFKVKKSIDNWNGSKGVTKIISLLLSIDYRFSQLLSRTGIQLPGLSAYCICRISPS